MALSISIFRTYIKLYQQPAEIPESVNQELKQRYPSGIFATAILLMLDSQGKGCFANAGHIKMELKNGDDFIALEETEGMPLGIINNSEYGQRDINLASKGTLVLYTDGVVEAKKRGSEEFGQERLRRLIKDNDFLPAPVLAERVLNAVSDFLQPVSSDDDLTVIVIKRG
jgi:serine phosphatase RsbU (regulator of sigma subunit)